MLQDTPSLPAYWRNVRARTVRVFDALRPKDLEWALVPGAFTFWDLFRHRLGQERWRVAETRQGRPSRTAGHGAEPTGGLASGLAGERAYLDQGHTESLAIFAILFILFILASKAFL